MGFPEMTQPGFFFERSAHRHSENKAYWGILWYSDIRHCSIPADCMNPKSFFKKPPATLTVPAVGAALLIAGGGIALWTLTHPSFAPGTLPIGANAIPQDALMVVSVTTDANQWQQLRSFGTPKSQAAFDQTLVQLRDRFLGANGLDYERDVKPWIGPEVTLAMLPPQSELAPPKDGQAPQPASPQPAVLVVPIADPIKAKQLLDQPKALQGRQWSDRTYKDIQIRESKGQQPAQNIDLAVLDGKLLIVANSARAVERAIETYKGDPSLAATPGYADALGQIQKGQGFASLYMNIPQTVISGNANLNRSQSQQSLEQVKQSQGWATVATLESEGLQLNSIFWLKPDSQRTFSVRNTAKTMPTRLPGDTVLMASGGDFKQFWSDYTRDFPSMPVKLLDPTSFRQEVRGALGMDLEQDFVNWMQGEFSISLVAAPPGTSPTTPIGLVLMVQASDRRAAEKALKQLDETMAKKYNFQIEDGKVADQPVVNWRMPGSEVAITHGWMDGNIAFLTLGAPVAQSFLPRPANNLASNPPFQQATDGSDDTTSGQFFMDFNRASTFKGLPLLRFPEANQVWLEAIKAVGISTVVSSDRTTRYNVRVLLQKGNPAGNLPPASSPSPSPSPKP